MSFLAKMGSWLFSGGGVEKVADVADKAFYTEQEKSADDQKDLDSARQFAAPSNGPGLINQIVDATNRMIRPSVTIWMIGGFAGWWSLPRIETISEYWQNIFKLVITFWFGGRVILKDLPQAIKAMRGK